MKGMDTVLEALRNGPAIVCYAKCGQCEYRGEHRKEWHTWADDDEAADMMDRGHPDPRTQQCGCHCQRGAVPPDLAPEMELADDYERNDHQ